MRSPDSWRAGATLVELVLVAAILALLAGSLYYIFDQMLKAYSRARGSLDFVNNGVLALAKVAEDVERAFVPAAPAEDPAHLFFVVGTDGPAGASDQVDFNIVTDQGVEELGYRLDASGRLLRRRQVTAGSNTVPDGTPGGAGSVDEPVAVSVEDFQLRYHYRTSAAGAFTFEGGTPAAAWDSRAEGVGNFSKLGVQKTPDGLPDLVEVRLAVSNPKNENQTKLFKTTVKVAASA